MSGAYARYQAKDYVIDINVWQDSSGNTRNIPPAYITKTGLAIKNQTIGRNDVSTSFLALQGTPDSRIQLTDTELKSFTLFHVARYVDGSTSNGRIFTTYSSSHNWLSGFWMNKVAIAYHDGWLSNPDAAGFSSNWILSTDKPRLYRANGVSTTAYRNVGGSYLPQLIVNSYEPGNFLIADVIIFDRVLSTDDISTMERYLGQKYGIRSYLLTLTVPTATPTIEPTSDPTKTPTLLPSAKPTTIPTALPSSPTITPSQYPTSPSNAPSFASK